MTRTFTKRPVWTWVCDSCGREQELARTQQELPTPDTMRSYGWFIAPLWGDKCPECVALDGVSDVGLEFRAVVDGMPHEYVVFQKRPTQDYLDNPVMYGDDDDAHNFLDGYRLVNLQERCNGGEWRPATPAGWSDGGSQ